MDHSAHNVCFFLSHNARAISSDGDLAYASRTSDEEANRFQLLVAIPGYLKQTHRGGRVYTLAGREVQHRFAQHVRLVNIGPADQVRRRQPGFPKRHLKRIRMKSRRR